MSLHSRTKQCIRWWMKEHHLQRPSPSISPSRLGTPCTMQQVEEAASPTNSGLQTAKVALAAIGQMGPCAALHAREAVPSPDQAADILRQHHQHAFRKSTIELQQLPP